LRWIRISEAIELLDAPGVIPAKLNDQAAAIKLAICDDIGEAAYDGQRIAVALIEIIQDLGYGAALQSRYHLDPHLGTGDDYLLAVAEKRCQNDPERAARQILNDFRKGILGAIPLELPPFA
jgi:ribosome biogenesis GTPase A